VSKVVRVLMAGCVLFWVSNSIATAQERREFIGSFPNDEEMLSAFPKLHEQFEKLEDIELLPETNKENNRTGIRRWRASLKGAKDKTRKVEFILYFSRTKVRGQNLYQYYYDPTITALVLPSSPRPSKSSRLLGLFFSRKL
jgi:hypothetical protein